MEKKKVNCRCEKIKYVKISMHQTVADDGNDTVYTYKINAYGTDV